MTTFFALFCTVDQPASYINGLLKHAEEHSFNAGNIFCLIESPDQKRVDKPTEPLVSDFKTGFKGWRNSKSQPPYISDNNFAVLDERTLRDGTVLLASYCHWQERIDPEDPSDEDEAFRHFKGFRTVRTERNSAADHASTLPEIHFNMVIESLKPEDDGVWRDPE
jgi:hypothetical protein